MINAKHTCVPGDKDKLAHYAVVDIEKWQDLAKRQLTPKQAVNELILDPGSSQKNEYIESEIWYVELSWLTGVEDVEEVPSLSQAKEKLRRIQTKKFPSSDEIVNIGEMFHKNILSLTTLDAKVGTMLTMTNDTLTQTLRTSEFMMMDGTFGVSNTDRTKRNAASLHIYREFKLRIETQLYLIGGFLQDHFLPLVYSYMGSRTTHAYVHLFCSVRNAIFSATEQAWMPPAVIIDHETAVIKALQFVFPGIDLWYVRAFWLIQCAGVQIYTCCSIYI